MVGSDKYSKVWDSSKIKDNSICISNSDIKFLNHDLKKCSVPSKIKEINAKGLSNTKS